jgi:ClpX C4-type zinc finger protein
MSTLNATQATVLLWMAEGSPAGVMEGSAHRVSGATLRTRGFVRTSGKGKTWKAEITDAGRDWLRRIEAGDTSGSEACTFCGLGESSGAHLVCGPGVYICHDCVHLAAEIVASGVVATDRVGSCTLVLEDASRHEVASGVHEAISRLGRDDSALVMFELVS